MHDTQDNFQECTTHKIIFENARHKILFDVHVHSIPLSPSMNAEFPGLIFIICLKMYGFIT